MDVITDHQIAVIGSHRMELRNNTDGATLGTAVRSDVGQPWTCTVGATTVTPAPTSRTDAYMALINTYAEVNGGGYSATVPHGTDDLP